MFCVASGSYAQSRLCSNDSEVSNISGEVVIFGEESTCHQTGAMVHRATPCCVVLCWTRRVLRRMLDVPCCVVSVGCGTVNCSEGENGLMECRSRVSRGCRTRVTDRASAAATRTSVTCRAPICQQRHLARPTGDQQQLTSAALCGGALRSHWPVIRRGVDELLFVTTLLLYRLAVRYYNIVNRVYIGTFGGMFYCTVEDTMSRCRHGCRNGVIILSHLCIGVGTWEKVGWPGKL